MERQDFSNDPPGARRMVENASDVNVSFLTCIAQRTDNIIYLFIISAVGELSRRYFGRSLWKNVLCGYNMESLTAASCVKKRPVHVAAISADLQRSTAVKVKSCPPLCHENNSAPLTWTQPSAYIHLPEFRWETNSS